MAPRNGMAVPLWTVDTGRHAGQAEGLEDWLYEDRPPYEPKHAAEF